jgi:hypothetical protein
MSRTEFEQGVEALVLASREAANGCHAQRDQIKGIIRRTNKIISFGLWISSSLDASCRDGGII